MRWGPAVLLLLVARGASAGSIDAEPRPASLLLKTVLGLLLLMALVWFGGLPAVRRFEERLGVRQIITGGLPFILLGLIAGHSSVGILDGEVLHDLTPIVDFALGWLGLIIGFQFDVRVLERAPRGTALDVALRSLVPFVTVGLAGSMIMLAFGESRTDATFLRDAIVLATAGAITASSRADRPGIWNPEESDRDLVRRLEFFDEIVAIAGLAVLGAFFRPQWVEFRWDLPGTVWLLLTLGVGASVGLLTYAVVAGYRRGAQFLALCLGSVAFASGIAGYLLLSPPVVCFIAGTLLVNLPGAHRRRVWTILTRLERPLYYLFLTIAGALWDITGWRGWVLVPVFIASRGLGNFLAETLVRRDADRKEPTLRPILWLAPPVSIVSIAIVISAQSMYRGRAVSWIVTAVLGGAILSELLHRRGAKR